MTNSAYSRLEARFRCLSDIEGALAILGWDQSTQMPAGGAGARGRQQATLSVIAHEQLIDPEIGDLLAAAADEPLDEWQQANVREMTRVRLAATAIPGDLVGRIEEARAASDMAWRGARAEADFAAAAPKLSALLELVRESAGYLAEAKSLPLYDALLDQFDPGLTLAAITPLFDDLAAYLPARVDEIIEAQNRAPQPHVPEPPFSRPAQEAFGRMIMAELGFDFERGRLDVSLHPFSGGVPDDSRITTRYDESDFSSGLMGIIHETGHAIYEQGLPKRWRDQPVGRSRGMTVHESQSLMMEMQLGRSPDFIAWAAPKLAEAYGGSGPEWTVQNLTRLYHRVERGFIRVDADEVTYPLHVILRMRLEQALLSGNLAVADLPAAWNDGMKESLGIVPPTDREGCLQDIHWYAGAFGYFPTYTLGALAAAQMRARIEATAPAIFASAATGDFAPLVGWLRENVHGHGCRYGTADLIANATGAALGADAFKAHIEYRYLAADRRSAA